MKAIIPCCGFGTRMGMKSSESKEMLLESNDKYVIEYSIDLCKKYDLEPLFLVRKEKKDLIHYLEVLKLKYHLMEPGAEWAETVLKSNEQWDEKNILLLPDTRFEPTDAIEQIKKSLDFGCETVFAIHEVEDISKWGFVTPFLYCEKPKLEQKGPAWGLIGFTKKAGNVIFNNMQNKNVYCSHDFSTNFVFLNSFKDITRTGKLE